jgi:hypothetical protein
VISGVPWVVLFPNDEAFIGEAPGVVILSIACSLYEFWTTVRADMELHSPIEVT